MDPGGLALCVDGIFLFGGALFGSNLGVFAVEVLGVASLGMLGTAKDLAPAATVILCL